MANQGQKRKFSRAGSWLTLFVDLQFITDVTFGHYDRFALYRFWEAFLKNRLITPHTDATALHYHPNVISFECNRQIPHSAFLSILLKTTSIYFCQEPGNRANERVSIY